ncbi:biotin/lipoyl-containing protein [Bdellovibrionota bacterium FG-2]
MEISLVRYGKTVGQYAMKKVLQLGSHRLELPFAHEGWKIVQRPGGWRVAVSPDGSKRFRFMGSEGCGSLKVHLKGRVIQGGLTSLYSAGSLSAPELPDDLVAQFPGKVRKLLVVEGERVAKGDCLVLVEAMKMEFSIRSPFSGLVTRVLVHEGQQVQPGDRFIE